MCVEGWRRGPGEQLGVGGNFSHSGGVWISASHASVSPVAKRKRRRGERKKEDREPDCFMLLQKIIFLSPKLTGFCLFFQIIFQKNRSLPQIKQKQKRRSIAQVRGASK